jgi:transcriptional regulator with XRE-family HTH domain
MVNLELWKSKRKEQKISLAELASMTDISISTLKDIFRGATTDPRIETVQRIERALGITQEQKTAPEYTDAEQQLFDLIKQLTDKETEELSNFVDFILSKRKG